MSGVDDRMAMLAVAGDDDRPPMAVEPDEDEAKHEGAEAVLDGNVKSIIVTPDVSLEGDGGTVEANVLFSVDPIAGGTRTASDIICVVDVSGSMQIEATLQGAGGKAEAHGLSILDVVKHATRTIIAMLEPTDRLAIVSYSTNATVVCGLTNMTEDGKKLANQKLDSLQPDGQTNLWDGLYNGLEVLRKRDKSEADSRLGSVLLLTDGCPNIEPPRGHLPMLKKYKDTHAMHCTISTFGFGYSLDSKLLREIAIEGAGMYAFIPDSSFVGTMFVNATSNLLVTMGKQASLSLELEEGTKVLEVYGSHPFSASSWGVQIELGTLQFGQTKDLVVKMSVPRAKQGKNYVTATLSYVNHSSSGPAKTVKTSVEGTNRAANFNAVNPHLVRLQAVDMLGAVVDLGKSGKLDQAQREVAQWAGVFAGQNQAKDDDITSLLEDLNGQVTQAVSKQEWFKKWGFHYLPSLRRAHQLQQCTNFKDPGVQHYGGRMFRAVRDRADDIFVKLPPPTPSARGGYGGGGGWGGGARGLVAAPRPVQMAAYHNAQGGCIAGTSLCHMADGRRVPVQQLRKGDVLAAPAGGKQARVACLVKTACPGGVADLVRLGPGEGEGACLVTPFHPVRTSDGQWQFPKDMAAVQEKMPCTAVYNLVLETGHVAVINGVDCVTLGHGFQQQVVKHPFLGTHAVVRQLQRMSGWRQGVVELQGHVRDTTTGLISGFIPA